MKLPICNFDAKAGILCPKCDAKLRSGHITKADVDVSNRLVKLASQIPELDRISLVRAYDIDGSIIMVLNSGDVVSLRRDNVLRRKIEHDMGNKMWLVDAQATDRKLLDDLFYPVRILSVNQVWLPDGSKMTRAIIMGRRTERFPLDLDLVKKMVKTVRGIELLAEFEKQ
ncbi:MAG: transcription elongation factor NusA [Thaumarchaeota archaeon]|nr:transcription elongation factor NusA [Nitrososphaerota archaeon]